MKKPNHICCRLYLNPYFILGICCNFKLNTNTVYHDELNPVFNKFLDGQNQHFKAFGSTRTQLVPRQCQQKFLLVLTASFQRCPAFMQTSLSWLYFPLCSVHAHHQMFLEFSTSRERRSAASKQLPSPLKQTLVHACKFVVSVYNLRSSQITPARNICRYKL